MAQHRSTRWRVSLVQESTDEYIVPRRCDGPARAQELARQLLADYPREALLTIYLDTRLQVIGHEITALGGISSGPADARSVFVGALLANAASVICAHNHPSGETVPSPSDIYVTSRLAAAGRLLAIPLHDTLIVAAGGGAVLSLRETQPALFDVAVTF